MPVRTTKTSRRTRRSSSNPKPASTKLVGKIKRQRLNETGVSSRIRGHVSARGKRAQAKKDSR